MSKRPRLRDELEECKKEIKKLRYDNERLKNDLFILDTKDSLKQKDFIEYKSIIIARMTELIKYIRAYKNSMSDIKKTFILYHGWTIVEDVFNRHAFSFVKEISMFVKIADCMNDILISRKDYDNLWIHNRKLLRIYTIVKDNLLKFECMYNIIYCGYELGFKDKCKVMIKDIKNIVNLEELDYECEKHLQRLKNKIYE